MTRSGQSMLRAFARPRRWLIVAGLSVFPIGCGGASDRDSLPDDVGPGVIRTSKVGPVTVTLRVTPAEVDLSQRAEVQVEVLAERGVTIEVDDYQRALIGSKPAFEYRVVRSFEEVAKPTGDGKLRWLYRYELEFFLPGPYELPSAQVRFVDQRTGGKSSSAVHRDLKLHADAPGEKAAPEVNWGEVKTDSLTIVARDSVERQLSLEELTRITMPAPIELPRPLSRWWWLGPLIVVAVVALAVLILRRAGRRRAERTVRIPADVWAGRRIAALLLDDLLARGLVREFYYRLSDIVRGYVERRFGVSAPEMTTEEFLTAAAADGRFGQRHTSQLNRFLGACDLVKYAGHEPALDEAGAMLEAARQFIDQTRERVRPNGAAETDSGYMKEQAA